MKKLTLALSLSLAFGAIHAPARAGSLFEKTGRQSVDESLAVGLDMMLQNTSLLRNGDDLLVRMREGFQMTEVNPELVRRIERQYAGNPAGLRRSMERSRKYLFYIMNEVERRGMPTELALLPVVESAFVPTARSHVGAAGLWQFMPATGRQYGLEQTWWYDGRRDVVGATNAALDYLQTLYGMFGDWSLALAAYNWGEGNVQRAVARARAQGLEPRYENLRLPNETRNYVPKLLAVRNVIAEPARFNIALDTFPNKPYFVAVSTGRHMDIEVAAKLAEMPVSEFRELNPAFNLPVYAHKSGRQMLLPADRLHRFERNIAKWDKPLMSWEVHVPQSATDASTTAQQFNMDMGELMRANNLRGSRFSAGQPVLVASSNTKAEPVMLRVANERRTSALEVPMLATIGSNETAAAPALLAEAETAAPAPQTAPIQLATAPQAASSLQLAANALDKLPATAARASDAPAPLLPDEMTAKAPMPAPARQTAALQLATTLQTPDLQLAANTLDKLPAKPDSSSGQKLLAVNWNGAGTTTIKAGSVQIRPASLQGEPSRPSATVLSMASAQQVGLSAGQAKQHVVGSGDTLYNIARRYSLSVPQLQALNGLEGNTLQPGQVLKVSGTPILATPLVAANEEAIRQVALLAPKPQDKPASREYVVQSGDTVFGIARKLGIHHTDIERWNTAAQLATLQPGQRLLIQGL